MAQTALVVSFLLGLGALFGVAVLTGRGRRRRRYAVAADWVTRERPSLLERTSDSPAAWTVAFVAVTLAFGLAAVAFVGGASVPAWAVAAVGLFLVAATGLVFALYVFYGTFVSARNRGLKNSQAALLGSWAVGTLLVVAVVFKLFGAF